MFRRVVRSRHRITGCRRFPSGGHRLFEVEGGRFRDCRRIVDGLSTGAATVCAMDVASEIVLRLADPVARPSVLTADALLAIGAVAYELDPELVTEPVTATFTRFDLA